MYNCFMHDIHYITQPSNHTTTPHYSYHSVFPIPCGVNTPLLFSTPPFPPLPRPPCAAYIYCSALSAIPSNTPDEGWYRADPIFANPYTTLLISWGHSCSALFRMTCMRSSRMADCCGRTPVVSSLPRAHMTLDRPWGSTLERPRRERDCRRPGGVRRGGKCCCGGWGFVGAVGGCCKGLSWVAVLHVEYMCVWMRVFCLNA